MSDTRTQQPSPCAVRRDIGRRWLQLIDDAWWLEIDIRAAPEGTFTAEEARAATVGLGEVVRDGLTNYRPRLPRSTFGAEPTCPTGSRPRAPASGTCTA